jgi:hypothetical protein
MVLVVLTLAMVSVSVAWTRPVPRIVVEPLSQDLGDLPQQRLELIYTVRNEGETSLHIDDVSTTCGCTKASVDEHTIPPGGTTRLQVTMDPQQDNLYGNLFRVITIRSNDPITPAAKVDFHVSIPKPGR